MPENPDWIELYRAALRETDRDKLPERIEQAERAMKQALRLAIESDDFDQRHGIAEDLHNLKTIRRGRENVQR